ncbi:MAG TPA: ferritin-like domain-containing protein [Micromonosporaceae bacterium]
MSGDERLAAALRAEHAAIFGYGVIGAHLGRASVDLARQAEQAHRDRRDALLVRLAAKGATPAPGEPAYTLPFPVTDRTSALRLAVQIEDRTAAVWREALGDLNGDERRLGLDALTDCAVRAYRWRKVAGITPPLVAFPGKPS